MAKVNMSREVKLNDKLYLVTAIIRHIGKSADSGCFTICVNRQNTWWLYDDNVPEQVSEDDAMRKVQGNIYMVLLQERPMALVPSPVSPPAPPLVPPPSPPSLSLLPSFPSPSLSPPPSPSPSSLSISQEPQQPASANIQIRCQSFDISLQHDQVPEDDDDDDDDASTQPHEQQRHRLTNESDLSVAAEVLKESSDKVVKTLRKALQSEESYWTALCGVQHVTMFLNQLQKSDRLSTVLTLCLLSQILKRPVKIQLASSAAKMDLPKHLSGLTPQMIQLCDIRQQNTHQVITLPPYSSKWQSSSAIIVVVANAFRFRLGTVEDPQVSSPSSGTRSRQVSLPKLLVQTRATFPSLVRGGLVDPLRETSVDDYAESDYAPSDDESASAHSDASDLEERKQATVTVDDVDDDDDAEDAEDDAAAVEDDAADNADAADVNVVRNDQVDNEDLDAAEEEDDDDTKSVVSFASTQSLESQSNQREIQLKGRPVTIAEYTDAFFIPDPLPQGGFGLKPKLEAYAVGTPNSGTDLHISTAKTTASAVANASLSIESILDCDSISILSTTRLLAESGLGQGKLKLYLHPNFYFVLSQRTSLKVKHNNKLEKLCQFPNVKVGSLETVLGNFDMNLVFPSIAHTDLKDEVAAFYVKIKEAICNLRPHPETVSMVCDASFGKPSNGSNSGTMTISMTVFNEVFSFSFFFSS